MLQGVRLIHTEPYRSIRIFDRTDFGGIRHLLPALLSGTV
jgi:hypothetical protein